MGAGSGTSMNMQSEDLESAEQKITGVIAGMAAECKSLSERTKRTVENWKGDSGNGFMQAALTLEKDYQKVIESLTEEVALIGTYRQTLVQFDQDHASMAEGMAQEATGGIAAGK